MAAVGRLDGCHVERPRRLALAEAGYKLPTIEPGQRIVKPVEANATNGIVFQAMVVPAAAL